MLIKELLYKMAGRKNVTAMVTTEHGVCVIIPDPALVRIKGAIPYSILHTPVETLSIENTEEDGLVVCVNVEDESESCAPNVEMSDEDINDELDTLTERIAMSGSVGGNKKSSEQKIAVETPLGTLVAIPSHDNDYPAIHIELRREDPKYAAFLAAIECDATAENPVMTACLYGDADSDDVTAKISYANLERFLECENFGTK